MSTAPIRLVLADDHQLFRRGLRQLLELEDDIRVIAEASNGVEALQALATVAPSVLLLDLSMPVLDGLGVLMAVRRDYPAVGVVVLTMHGEEPIVLRALAAGAQGLVRKDSDSGDVISAIRAVAAGRAWVEPRATVFLLEEYRRLNELAGRQTGGRLSDRDTTLLRLLASGYSNKEIAASLGLAESTIKNQLGGLFDRLGVSDRTQAALYAFSHGLLTAEGATPPEAIARAARDDQA